MTAEFAPIMPVRGRVYLADLGHGDKPWLVVSNSARNTHLSTCLAAHITTTDRVRVRTTVVDLDAADPLVGRVLCDDLEQLDRVDLRRDVGRPEQDDDGARRCWPACGAGPVAA